LIILWGIKKGRIRNKLRRDKRKKYLAEEWAQLYRLNINRGDLLAVHLLLFL